MPAQDQRFYAYYKPGDLSTIQRAIDQLDQYILMEGPFDAVMGFSAGAVLAAMYLVDKQRRQGPLPFKCAVFLAAGSSTDDLACLKFELPSDSIRIPTMHTWGSADEIAPTGGPDLAQICDSSHRETSVHDGGHELPRQAYLTETVHKIRRTVLTASQ